VHLSSLRLRSFRNYARLDVTFMPGFHLLLGGNAQGKTNLLEAIYLLSTLRSFRGVGAAQMLRYGAGDFFVGGEVLGDGRNDIRLYWSPQQRKLSINGQPVRALADFYGRVRTVVFCTEDLLLVKGPAVNRRRFMDLLLAQTQPGYLALLQRYARVLRSRNALLKRPSYDAMALDGFTRELIAAGNEIIRRRTELLPALIPLAQQAYARIAGESEQLGMDYHPSVKNDFAVELVQSRERERVYRTTIIGPHRDELRLLLDGKPAAQFASEGQKRSLAIALKMAQAQYLAMHHGTPPILLIDDVMGELDARRRAGLLPLLERSHQANGQVFMTCTEENWPRELGRNLQKWEVVHGTLRRLD